MFSQTHFIFMLFETNFVFMLFALMLFGNSPNQPVLTTQGNPPVANALPIAAPPVATAVVMTHFVVARSGFFLEKPQE